MQKRWVHRTFRLPENCYILVGIFFLRMKLNGKRLLEIKNWYELEDAQIIQIKNHFQKKNTNWLEIEEYMDSDEAMNNRLDSYSLFIEKRSNYVNSLHFSEDQLYEFSVIFRDYLLAKSEDEKQKCIHIELINQIYECLDKNKRISVVKFIELIWGYWAKEYKSLFENYKSSVDEYQKLITLFENKLKIQELYSKFSNPEFFFTNVVNNNFKSNEIKPGFVYIAKQLNSVNTYKIGKTNQITIREKTFKTGNLYIQIVAYVESMQPYKLESLLHLMFSEKNIIGEWFVLEESDIEILVKEFNFKFGIEFNK